MQLIENIIKYGIPTDEKKKHFSRTKIKCDEHVGLEINVCMSSIDLTVNIICQIKWKCKKN